MRRSGSKALLLRLGGAEGKAAAQCESGRHGCHECPAYAPFIERGRRPPQGCSEPMKVVSPGETEGEREGPAICPVVVVEELLCLLSRGEGRRCICFLGVLHLGGSIAPKKETEEGSTKT